MRSGVRNVSDTSACAFFVRSHPFDVAKSVRAGHRSYWLAPDRSVARKTTPSGGTGTFVKLLTALPSGSKKSTRIDRLAVEVFPTAISVVHPPPVTICGNTSDG